MLGQYKIKDTVYYSDIKNITVDNDLVSFELTDNDNNIKIIKLKKDAVDLNSLNSLSVVNLENGKMYVEFKTLIQYENIDTVLKEMDILKIMKNVSG